MEVSTAERLATPAAEVVVGLPTEVATEAPAAAAAAKAPAAGVAVEEAQPEPSLVGDAAGGASDTSE